MRLAVAIWAFCIAVAVPFSVAAQQPDRLLHTSAAGIPVTVVTIDLRNPSVHVSVEVADGFPHASQDFSEMVARVHPLLAVNGAYFSRDTLAPIGDIVAHNQLLYQGLMGTAFAITADNRAIIRRVEPDHAEDWTQYATVLACGPALVLNGEIAVDPQAERFHDPHILAPARRMGLALDGDSHLLIVTTQLAVTFDQWAQVMLALHAQDAMNLDAGASLAFYYRGKTLITPGRNLTNILTVSLDEPAP
ncbi:MAG: hypothetical protein NVSMB31_14220 [Vulcanimicrobiaceae bacterium]